MKKYVVRFGQEVKVWKNVIVLVEAENEEEAKKKAMDFDIEDLISDQYITEDEEILKDVFDHEQGDYVRELNEGGLGEN